MARKHYIAIAELLQRARRDADEDTEHGYGRHLALDSVTYDLAHVFHMDNPNYDSARFFEAAGLRDVIVPDQEGR